ncbi:hypothetical protein Tco_0440609, partial [Tanacetum coccineum]
MNNTQYPKPFETVWNASGELFVAMNDLMYKSNDAGLGGNTGNMFVQSKQPNELSQKNIGGGTQSLGSITTTGIPLGQNGTLNDLNIESPFVHSVDINTKPTSYARATN